jgi:serine/threonine protein phosphatase PrpC
MLALEIAILSEQGGRSYNEDACGHWHSQNELCCVVADGAGGHGGGGFASRLAVERLLQSFAARPDPHNLDLQTLIRDTNQAVIAARVPNTERANMHSTVVALAIDFAHHRAQWAHAGDSRLYWFRGGHLLAQTRDHSLVQALVDGGLLSPDQMRTHPSRSELRSALGTDDDVLEVSDSGEPRAVEAGDVFLLCTDGLWEYVDERQLEDSLRQSDSPAAWLATLEEGVTVATRHKASHDNFTALTVWTAAAPGAAAAGTA